MDDEFNLSGVALALTLARYFKRWSLWSKDIIFLITSDSKAGPQAWVEAYHDGHSPLEVESLPLKSGALEGAIVVDNPQDHRFETLHVSYDGINGQLPNLDLFNTAVAVSRGQHGIGAALQKMWKHDDTYEDRLRTMLRGMTNQGLGHASGPHSSFIPYHVDAITLRAVGDGWQDDMALGRVVESLFRSLNNLMEHFHQSFFLYLLMQTNRFVSIGTYLPSAMLVAANFTIMAISLWIASGRQPPSTPTVKLTEKLKPEDFEITKKDGMTAAIPKQELAIQERQLLFPAALVLGLHFLGVVPLYIFNNIPQSMFSTAMALFSVTNIILPFILMRLLSTYCPLSPQQRQLTKCFSLLLLGMFLATLATINFSLSFIIGLLSAPLSLVGQSPVPRPANTLAIPNGVVRLVQSISVLAFSPPMIFYIACSLAGLSAEFVLTQAAFGWRVWGVWTQVIIWCVWWPAWLAGAIDVAHYSL
ncbi:MAG: Glycosyl phosphatidyl inositol protein transamidase complex subunit [Stictis urceolatum]|nr:Glycosyl phosphatidyl inositol protein transamidase complex subunit [Stictis urceolata]